jgi:hypothetical protein
MTAATRLSQFSRASLLTQLDLGGNGHDGPKAISAKELWQLRFRLEEALDEGRMDSQTRRALLRLRQLGRREGRLTFEYRRFFARFERAGLSPFGGLMSV